MSQSQENFRIDRRMDGRMEGWKDGRTEGSTEGRTEGRTDPILQDPFGYRWRSKNIYQNIYIYTECVS